MSCISRQFFTTSTTRISIINKTDSSVVKDVEKSEPSLTVEMETGVAILENTWVLSIKKLLKKKS